MRQRSLRAVYMRGGTSKGVFLRGEDLPPPGAERDALLLEIMGSPDPMQIDGMGGTFSSTSKVMAVSPSTAPDCDIDYLFGQVAIDRPAVDYRGNCGNLTAAIGPYALDEGLLGRVGGRSATVRLRNLNTGVRVISRFGVIDGVTDYDGEHHIDGVPRPGGLIENDYLDPAGHICGALLPTGRAVDMIPFEGREFAVSLVDASNPVAFVRAADLGIEAGDLPARLNADGRLLARLERLRGECAVRLGFARDAEEAALVAAAVPFLSLVGPPAPFTSVDGARVAAEATDLWARTLSTGRIHHACQITTLICTAAAARVPHSVVNEVARPGGDAIRLGHARGVTSAIVRTAEVDGVSRIASVGVTRTARRLMAGEVYVRSHADGSRPSAAGDAHLA